MSQDVGKLRCHRMWENSDVTGCGKTQMSQDVGKLRCHRMWELRCHRMWENSDVTGCGKTQMSQDVGKLRCHRMSDCTSSTKLDICIFIDKRFSITNLIFFYTKICTS